MLRTATIRKCTKTEKKRAKKQGKKAREAKWCLVTKHSKPTRVLGYHATRKGAEKQEAAIKARGGSVKLRSRLAAVSEQTREQLFQDKWAQDLAAALNKAGMAGADPSTAKQLFYRAWDYTFTLLDEIFEAQTGMDTTGLDDPTFLQAMASFSFFVANEAIRDVFNMESDSSRHAGSYLDLLFAAVGKEPEGKDQIITELVKAAERVAEDFMADAAEALLVEDEEKERATAASIPSGSGFFEDLLFATEDPSTEYLLHRPRLSRAEKVRRARRKKRRRSKVVEDFDVLFETLGRGKISSRQQMQVQQGIQRGLNVIDDVRQLQDIPTRPHPKMVKPESAKKSRKGLLRWILVNFLNFPPDKVAHTRRADTRDYELPLQCFIGFAGSEEDVGASTVTVRKEGGRWTVNDMAAPLDDQLAQELIRYCGKRSAQMKTSRRINLRRAAPLRDAFDVPADCLADFYESGAVGDPGEMAHFFKEGGEWRSADPGFDMWAPSSDWEAEELLDYCRAAGARAASTQQVRTARRMYRALLRKFVDRDGYVRTSRHARLAAMRIRRGDDEEGASFAVDVTCALKTMAEAGLIDPDVAAQIKGEGLVVFEQNEKGWFRTEGIDVGLDPYNAELLQNACGQAGAKAASVRSARRRRSYRARKPGVRAYRGRRGPKRGYRSLTKDRPELAEPPKRKERDKDGCEGRGLGAARGCGGAAYSAGYTPLRARALKRRAMDATSERDDMVSFCYDLLIEVEYEDAAHFLSNLALGHKGALLHSTHGEEVKKTAKDLNYDQNAACELCVDLLYSVDTELAEGFASKYGGQQQTGTGREPNIYVTEEEEIYGGRGWEEYGEDEPPMESHGAVHRRGCGCGAQPQRKRVRDPAARRPRRPTREIEEEQFEEEFEEWEGGGFRGLAPRVPQHVPRGGRAASVRRARARMQALRR